MDKIRIADKIGDYANWLTFKELFKSFIISRADVSSVDKLLYLMGHLEGPAHNVISGTEMTEDGFSSAWNALCKHYDNDRLVIETHIKGILTAGSMTGESSSELRNLLNCFNTHLRSLKLMKQPVDSWGIFMIYILASKLSPQTFKQWQTSLKLKDIPTWTEFEDFLQCLVRILESSETLKPENQFSKGYSKPLKFDSKFNKTSSKTFVSTNRLCSFCKASDHKTHRCLQYTKLTPSQKLQKVLNLKLCQNFLKATHLMEISVIHLIHVLHVTKNIT
jgi:hypothetical protein